jgi:hypothetical protein
MRYMYISKNVHMHHSNTTTFEKMKFLKNWITQLEYIHTYIHIYIYIYIYNINCVLYMYFVL